MAGPLDQLLHEQVVRALLEDTHLAHAAVEANAYGQVDVVIVVPGLVLRWQHGRVLPVDVVTAEKLERSAPSRTVSVEGVAPADMILDIGRRSIEHVCSVLARAKTLVWNGPLGAFETEPFDIGTIEVAEAAAELSSAGDLVSVAGGGDTVSALHAAGAAERFTYVSTAGGAFLEWLEGRRLPGVEILKVQ